MKIAMLLAVLGLAGCVTVPALDPASLPTTAAKFKEGDGRSAPGLAAMAAGDPWWKAFSDPVLDGLVERAARNNNSIQVAVARLTQARAAVRATDSLRSPQVGVGASAQRGVDITTLNQPLTVGTVGANLSYEIDLFGRLAEASRAASLDAAARESLLASTRLLVQADVAQVYLAIRAIDTERSLVRDTVETYRDSLSLTERRYRAGDVAELDVARGRTEVASNEAEGLALDRRRAELEHALAVLVGDAASGFSLGERDWDMKLPVVPPGVPASVLARRPDVAAAQSSMLAAQSRVGVARAAWFPGISLTGSGGYQSTELGDLFKWSMRSWGIGALLSLPVFDGGRRDAEIERSRAELDAALAQYREQVLVAFRDVEDQLAALRLLSLQADAQKRAVDAASRATELSNTRYRNGYTSQLDLLDAQRSELRNRRQALQVRSAQYQATVGLIRALGGGWEASQ
jgi:multidrug efflux system outer membrane protein